MPFIVCNHSDTYNSTSKPEKGEGMLTQPATANNYARQPALINRVGYWMFIQRLAITGFVSLLAPLFSLFVRYYYVTVANIRAF